MIVQNLVDLIDAEIAKLQDARTVLIKSEARNHTHTAPVIRRKRHTMSPAARKRIAEAMRKRWRNAKAKAA